MTTGNSEILRVGSRKFCAKSLLPRPTRQPICAVGVSTIVFNSQLFVSGLRMIFGDSVTSKQASYSIGYVTPDSESLFWVSPLNFAGFELATRVNGIIGIRVISETGGHSTWAGNIGQGGPDIAFGMLPVENSMHSFNLAASFDVSYPVIFNLSK